MLLGELVVLFLLDKDGPAYNLSVAQEKFAVPTETNLESLETAWAPQHLTVN